MTALLESSDFDAVISVIGSSAVGRPNLVANPVARASATTTKPVLCYVSPWAPGIIQRLNSEGVPTFDSPEGCASVLAALAATSRQANDTTIGIRSVPDVIPFVDHRGALNEAQAKELFTAFGIDTPQRAQALTPCEANTVAAEFDGDPVTRPHRVHHL